MKNVILAEPSTLALLGLGFFLLCFGVVAVLGTVAVLTIFLTRKARREAPPTSQATASTQAAPKNCPKCGASMPPDSPEGLCPRCLIALNLATQTDIPGEPGAAKTPPGPPLPVGDIAKLFPQLEILECLGRGGMGAVYKVRQPRLDRLVALKILSPEKQGNQKFAERFEREARALAKLHHPNIVTVYDFGEVEGNFYLLMEFVDGLSLRQLLQSHKLSPPEALAIVPKICEALQYAHEQGIVHRDIKPENILMDKDGRVKIADFGIAKILGDGGGSNLTAEQVIGTPHYMSPEQIEKPQSVDHRADIYSLGVVFYEMLTGELPLGKFQPPSKKVQVDVRLDEIVLRALEKEPERRYQQASEVKSHVETIAATPAAAIQKPDHFWRRFAVAVLAIFSIPFFIAIVGILAAIAIPAFIQGRQHALALRQYQIGTSPFYVGSTWFPEGDSIQITSVQRNENHMTVRGHYNLVSHDEAALKLDGVSNTPVNTPQCKWIAKGNGDFVLTDPNAVTSMPSITMYVNGLHTFATINFGNEEEADRERRFLAGRSASPADQGHPRVLLTEKEEAKQMCISNLRQIDAAKHMWALMNKKSDGAVPTVEDLQSYIQGGFPVCPDGGTYSINPIGEPPTCSVPGHTLSGLNSASNPAPTMTGMPGSVETTLPTFTTSQIAHLQEIVAETQVNLVKSQTQLAQLSQMNNAQLRQVLPGLVNDSLLNSLLQELDDAQLQSAALNVTHGSNSPVLVSLNARMNVINHQIDDRMNGIMIGLKDQVEAQEAAAKALADKLGQTAGPPSENNSFLTPTNHPKVISVSPADGATVDPQQDIHIRFDQPMNPNDMNILWYSGGFISHGQFHYHPARNEFDIPLRLVPGTTNKLSVSWAGMGFRNTNSISADQFDWQFTTRPLAPKPGAAKPNVVQVSPKPGETKSVLTILELTFDQPMSLDFGFPFLRVRGQSFNLPGIVPDLRYDPSGRRLTIPLMLPPDNETKLTLEGFYNTAGAASDPVVVRCEIGTNNYSDQQLKSISTAAKDPKLKQLLSSMQAARSRLCSGVETVTWISLNQEKGAFDDFTTHSAIFKWQGTNQFYEDISGIMGPMKAFMLGSDGETCWLFGDDISQGRVLLSSPVAGVADFYASIADPFNLEHDSVQSAIEKGKLVYEGQTQLDSRPCYLISSWQVEQTRDDYFPVSVARSKWWIDSETFLPAQVVRYIAGQQIYKFRYEGLNRPLPIAAFQPPTRQGTKSLSWFDKKLGPNETLFFKIKDGSDGQMSGRIGRQGPKGSTDSGLN